MNQLTYFAFFQGLFLIIIFVVSGRKRQKINAHLLVLVLLLLIGLIGKIGHLSLGWSRQLKGISEYAILFFGPTVYLFVQSTLSEKAFTRKDLVHYIPGVVYSLIVTFYYILAPQKAIQARIESGEFFRVVRILVGIGLSVNLSYFYLSVSKFQELKAKLEEELSYELNIAFVKHFLITIGLCLAIWLLIYLISFGNSPQVEVISRSFIWMAIALIVLFISYYQMLAPSAFQFEYFPPKRKYAQSKFSASDLVALELKLEKTMKEMKPFLDAKLLKSDLAAMLQINAPELSRLLNERLGMSFFEYVNYHRVQEFIRLARSPLIRQKTLLGLAQDAGFQSKSTFNKSFKSVMGCPPSEYLQLEPQEQTKA